MDRVENAAAIDRIIESCRALCLDVRWHDVYALATSVELEEVNPALLRMKVTAACALNDKTLLAALAPEIIDLPDDHALFYPLVGQIQRSGHGDIGADMLLARANAAADPRYAVFLRRAISLNRGDEGRTATLEAALNAATNGGWDMKGEPSSHHFPAPLPALMGPPVQIVPAPGVDRRYIDRLTGDAAKFLARMQKPAPGYIVEESFRHFRCRLAVARPGIIVTLPRFHASTLPRFHASTLPSAPGQTRGSSRSAPSAAPCRASGRMDRPANRGGQYGVRSLARTVGEIATGPQRQDFRRIIVGALP
jgi:hypothetical protein